MKKQETTLEEIAERLVKETTLYGSQEASIGSSARSYFETELRCVLLGMQWQQEQDKNKYSEEEVLELLLNCPGPYLTDDEIKEWFNKIKKK